MKSKDMKKSMGQVLHVAKKNFLIVLVLVLVGVLIWTSVQNAKNIAVLEKDYNTLSLKQAKEIRETRDAVKLLGSYFDETDQNTIVVLSATIDRLEAAIEVYDNNVLIYNQRIETLQKQVNAILQFLNNY